MSPHRWPLKWTPLSQSSEKLPKTAHRYTFVKWLLASNNHHDIGHLQYQGFKI